MYYDVSRRTLYKNFKRMERLYMILLRTLHKNLEYFEFKEIMTQLKRTVDLYCSRCSDKICRKTCPIHDVRRQVEFYLGML